LGHPVGDPGVPYERLRLDDTHREREQLALRVSNVAHSLDVSTLVRVKPTTHKVQVLLRHRPPSISGRTVPTLPVHPLPDAGQERKEVELTSTVLRAEGGPADRDLLACDS
jgi:hypothetical protein